MITEQDYLTAEKNGISRQYVRNRVKRHGDIQRAITEPVTRYRGLYAKYRQQCEAIGLSREGFDKRIRSGMKPELAAVLPKS